MSLAKLTGCVIEYYGSPRRVEHSLKVYAYAMGIGGEEGVGSEDALVLGAAALLHDIGIPSARERFGPDPTGKYHEEEGERMAPDFLERAGIPEAFRRRVASLVGRHHAPTGDPAEPLLQLLREADFLVNLVEGNLPDVTPDAIYKNEFRTETGKRYLRALYPDCLS